jgi:hypothetical protein
MTLIDGFASNGTYSGLIPPQKNGSVVAWDSSFKDDLNYTNKVRYPFAYYTFGVKGLPQYMQSNTQRIQDHMAIYTTVMDYNGNTKNVTLNYLETPPFSKVFKSNYDAVHMKLVAFLLPFSKVYEATIPIIKGDKILFYSTLTDFSGDRENSTPAQPYLPIKPYFPIQWNSTFSSVDIDNQTAHINFGFYDPSVNTGNQVTIPSTYSNGQYRCVTAICIGVDRLDNSTVRDTFLIPLGSRIDRRGFGDIAVYNLPASTSFPLTPASTSFPLTPASTSFPLTPASTSFPLTGDPSEFPFDQYSLNLRLVIPYNPPNIEFSNHYNKSVNSSLVPFFDGSMVNEVVSCKETLNSNESSYCDMDPAYVHDDKPSFWLLHFNFMRNYTVELVTIPMLAIFYLLGAVFILESTTDQLTIRLAITLGIFAFLFTFTPIINQMKPPATVTKIPTVADSLITIILVATIAFSVSSVISGSPVVKKKFPRGSIWIDRIVFFVISGIIIWYFRYYPLDITMWIVPVIIFGLGYGLLLRASGTKMAEKLEKVFKKDVKGLERSESK